MTITPKIDSKDLSLADLYLDFYTVPDYQREFVWQPENVEKLLEDIYNEFYDGGSQVSSDSEYFIGSIVTCPSSDDTHQLIDGQQRLTTTYLSLCAIRDSLSDHYVSIPAKLDQQIADVSTDRRTGEDVLRNRLVLQYEDSQGILDKIAGKSSIPEATSDTTRSVRNIVLAYETAKEFLSVNFGTDTSRMKTFYADLTLRVKLIRIVTPNVAHALKVFETINDRGVGLNSMDLLKNLLFIKTPDSEYPALKAQWKQLIDTLGGCGEKPLRFLRYYVMARHFSDPKGILREDEIYDWFVNHTNEVGIASFPLAFVSDLVSNAKDYDRFVSSKDISGSDNRYLRNIHLLSRGSARQHFILLLAGRHLPPCLFSELCHNIEDLFFCYLVTREPTNSLERNFARWAKPLRAVADQEGLNQFLDEHFQPELVSRSAAFDFTFGELDRSRIQQYRLRYVLAKLAQYIDEHAWENPSHRNLGFYLDRSIHVEHILPMEPSSAARQQFDEPDK